MAEELIPGLSMQGISNATSGLTSALLYMLIALVVGGLAWLYAYHNSFKIKAVIRETVNGRSIVSHDKIRIFKDKNGILKWMLWKGLFVFKKPIVPIPEADYIDITVKGRKFVEFFRTPDNQYIPIRANPRDIIDGVGADFEPFTTAQRTMQVQEYREAEAYKRKPLSELLINAFPYIVTLLIIVIFMIFFNDVVAPTKDLADSNIAASKELAHSLQVSQDTNRLMVNFMNRIDPELVKGMIQEQQQQDNMSVDVAPN